MHQILYRFHDDTSVKTRIKVAEEINALPYFSAEALSENSPGDLLKIHSEVSLDAEGAFELGTFIGMLVCKC
jgi:uncharacterized protein YqjF (DUF2071 family)